MCYKSLYQIFIFIAEVFEKLLFWHSFHMFPNVCHRKVHQDLPWWRHWLPRACSYCHHVDSDRIQKNHLWLSNSRLMVRSRNQHGTALSDVFACLSCVFRSVYHWVCWKKRRVELRSYVSCLFGHACYGQRNRTASQKDTEERKRDWNNLQERIQVEVDVDVVELEFNRRRHGVGIFGFVFVLAECKVHVLGRGNAGKEDHWFGMEIRNHFVCDCGGFVLETTLRLRQTKCKRLEITFFILKNKCTRKRIILIVICW